MDVRPIIVLITNFHRYVLIASIVILIASCGRGRESLPAVADEKRPIVSEPKDSAKSDAARPLTAEGLAKGIPLSGVVRGRVYMGGSDIGKAEVVLAEYDLKTATAGIPLGLAVTDKSGNFSIPYALRSPQTFLILEVRAIDYQGPTDDSSRRVAMLSAIVNGLPRDGHARIAVTPLTNVIYARFRALVLGGLEPNLAFSQAVAEVRQKGAAGDMALNFSPVLTVVQGDDPGKPLYAVWDEAIRFDYIQPDSFYSVMAKDFSDGQFDDTESGKALTFSRDVLIAGHSPGLLLSAGYFTHGLSAAAKRLEICSNAKLESFAPQREQARCPVRKEDPSTQLHERVQKKD